MSGFVIQGLQSGHHKVFPTERDVRVHHAVALPLIEARRGEMEASHVNAVTH